MEAVTWRTRSPPPLGALRGENERGEDERHDETCYLPEPRGLHRRPAVSADVATWHHVHRPAIGRAHAARFAVAGAAPRGDGRRALGPGAAGRRAWRPRRRHHPRPHARRAPAGAPRTRGAALPAGREPLPDRRASRGFGGRRYREWSGRGLARIAQRGAGFVSRGDSSGTHVRELALWAAAGVRLPS